MHMETNIPIEHLFENVFNKLSRPDFGENLGGELPLFIQPIKPSEQSKAEIEIVNLVKRLNNKGIKAERINLYDLIVEILSEAGVLETLLNDEKELNKEEVVIPTLESLLDVSIEVIPRIQKKIEATEPDYLIISGVGNAYPFIRSHNILNNIDSLTKGTKIVLFFPGEYDNLQLKLFGRISDENYYRGHNINDIK